MKQFIKSFPGAEKFGLQVPATWQELLDRLDALEEGLMPLQKNDPALLCEISFLRDVVRWLVENGEYSLDDLRTHTVEDILRIRALEEAREQLSYGLKGFGHKERVDFISGRFRERLLEQMEPVAGAPTTQEFGA